MSLPTRSGLSLTRSAVSRTGSVLACLLVYVALIAPNELGQVTPAALLRVPLEALIGALLVLVLPDRMRRVVALAGGAVLGLLTVVRILGMGFMTILGRPFDPLFDWAQLGSGVRFLRDSIGGTAAIATAVVAGVLAALLVAGMARAVLRVSGLVARHRTATVRAVPVAAVFWGTCFALGAQVVTPVPVAAWSTASLAYRTSAQVSATWADHQEFGARFAAHDVIADVPPDNLLKALRGKDIVLTFVESYGRSAVEDPALAPQIDPVLDEGTRRLAAAGFGARSAYLTSPVHGGGSWLAHATLLSGLWVGNQHDYDTLVASDRLTLTGAFQRADWRTVGMMPGLTSDWPEGTVYDLDQVYDTRDLGYRGSSFTGFHTPDQYTLAAMERLEHGKRDRPPLMIEMPLVTSHWPWTPVPEPVDWSAVGDGSVYNAMADGADPVEAVWSDPAKVKAAYAQSVRYSLESLISWTLTYGDDDTVLVFLGDHQPAPVVSGGTGGDDVPITIVAKDPAVLDRISGWGWDEGLNPGPRAPVTRMDAFRDQFLTAFSAPPSRKH